MDHSVTHQEGSVEQRGRSPYLLRLFLAAIIGIAAAVVWFNHRSSEVRYRVSFTLNDNGVVRSASGVWSDEVWPALIPLANKYETAFHGEAIPMRLLGRGVLLLTPVGETVPGEIAGNIVRNLFSWLASAPDSDRVGNTAEVGRMIGRSRPIRCKSYATPQPPTRLGQPTADLCLRFIFVSDPRDQSTLQRMAVEQGRFVGLSGVRLTDARITITRDPITRGLEQLLPWLPSAQEYWRTRQITDQGKTSFAYEIIFMKK